jgi:putative ABC transport system permease protein
MRATASIAEAFAMAGRSLRSSKLRSFLTLLGIILSTTTLIAVMSVIHGMNVYIADKIADLGSDGFTIQRWAFLGDFTPKKFLELQKKNPELSREEFEFLKANSQYLSELGMGCETTADVEFGSIRAKDVNINGGTANLNLLSNLQTESGRYFSAAEDANRKQVAFIGQDLVEQFFTGTDPVGKTIRIAGLPFEVIGVGKKVGSVFGQSQDNYVHVPVETFFKMYGSRRWIYYQARALDRDRLPYALDESRALLRGFRHVPPGREDNFAMVTSDAIMGLWDRLTGVIASTAIAVVSVFMVVGGVVIMNIMLAVVTERTQEIGVRKSLGARRRDILYQFLIESAVLSASGGLLGVIIAWIIAVIVRNFTPVPMVLPVSSVVVGVSLSAIVGLFFGIYPATRAAKLDPIEALRAEH